MGWRNLCLSAIVFLAGCGGAVAPDDDTTVSAQAPQPLGTVTGRVTLIAGSWIMPRSRPFATRVVLAAPFQRAESQPPRVSHVRVIAETTATSGGEFVLFAPAGRYQVFAVYNDMLFDDHEDYANHEFRDDVVVSEGHTLRRDVIVNVVVD